MYDFLFFLHTMLKDKLSDIKNFKCIWAKIIGIRQCQILSCYEYSAKKNLEKDLHREHAEEKAKYYMAIA